MEEAKEAPTAARTDDDQVGLRLASCLEDRLACGARDSERPGGHELPARGFHVRPEQPLDSFAKVLVPLVVDARADGLGLAQTRGSISMSDQQLRPELFRE